MLEHGGWTGLRTVQRSLIFAALRKFAFLHDEVEVGSPQLARIGLVAVALGLQTIVLHSPGHFQPAGIGIFAVLVTLGTLGSLALCVLSTENLQRVLSLQARKLLGVGAFFALGVLAVLGASHVVSGLQAMQRGTPYSNDGAVMDLYAAQQTLHGHNPYYATNIVKALAAINAPSTTTTPLMDGQFRGARAYPTDGSVQQVFLNVLRYRPRTIPPEFESKYNYPSGSFLFILPFVWAGLNDMRFLYILAVIGMGVYLWRRLPPTLRFLAPFVVMADVPLIGLTMGGQPDPVYGLFLMIGLAEWRRTWTSSVLTGVAMATKQLAWFFAPFYAVLVIREYGWREGLRRGAVMACVFVALNGPFIALSPLAYLRSVSGPMSDPMFPLGIGFIALFVSNVVPMMPKIAFTLVEMGVWIGTAGVFAKFRRLSPALVAVLGVVPLLFAWRSLVNYFYLAPLFVLAMTLVSPPMPQTQRLTR